jgi:hypothetical protein
MLQSEVGVYSTERLTARLPRRGLRRDQHRASACSLKFRVQGLGLRAKGLGFDRAMGSGRRV